MDISVSHVDSAIQAFYWKNGSPPDSAKSHATRPNRLGVSHATRHIPSRVLLDSAMRLRTRPSNHFIGKMGVRPTRLSPMRLDRIDSDSAMAKSDPETDFLNLEAYVQGLNYNMVQR